MLLLPLKRALCLCLACSFLKVLRGGKNLIDEVEKLEAAAAAGAEALAQQRAAQAAAQARIAALEAAASEAEGRHSSVQVGWGGQLLTGPGGGCSRLFHLLAVACIHFVDRFFLAIVASKKQEEAAAKRARLQRLAAATAAARQEAGSLAAQCQAERERLLDDIRRLTTQMQQKVGWHGGRWVGTAVAVWKGSRATWQHKVSWQERGLPMAGTPLPLDRQRSFRTHLHNARTSSSARASRPSTSS